MKITEHLMFLALMVPTILLLAIAAVLLAQPTHPTTGFNPQTVAAMPVRAIPVDELRYEAPY